MERWVSSGPCGILLGARSACLSVAGKPAWVWHPIPSPSTTSPSPFLLGDSSSDSPISDVLSGSKVCKTESGAEMSQISSSEVATTVFAVTFPLSCARNRSLPLGSPQSFRRWCTRDLIVPCSVPMVSCGSG